MARVLFVYSIDGHRRFDRRPLSTAAIQLGISYISALLRQHGHETSLVVLESKRGPGDFALLNARVAAVEPDLICHTAVATQYAFIAAVAAHLRTLRPDLFQVIGGPHVSLNPEQAIADGFDAVCTGEGEYPTLELVSQLESNARPSGVRNLWIRTGADIEKNPPRPFLQPLDSLPPPDRALWDEWLDPSRPPIHTVLLGRGCPYECTYCCNHALRRLADGPYVRMRDPAAIVREIESLAPPPDVEQEMYLEVETLLLDRQWTEQLCTRLAELNAARRRPIRFGANVRVTPTADIDGFFRALARANICSVNIGLESGSERVRREVLRRYYSNADVLRTVRAARAQGMRVALYNLIGLPGETPADFLQTARMNRLCAPDAARTSIFFPYPGTELHRVCRERGLLPPRLALDRERRRAVLDLPGFSRRRIQRCFDFFDLYVAHANPAVRSARIIAARCAGRLGRVRKQLAGLWGAAR